MASAFVGSTCDPVEFYKAFPPLGGGGGRGESTHDMRNYINFQKLGEQSRIKPHALSDEVFFAAKRAPKHNTFHFKQGEQTKGELTSYAPQRTHYPLCQSFFGASHYL